MIVHIHFKHLLRNIYIYIHNPSVFITLTCAWIINNDSNKTQYNREVSPPIMEYCYTSNIWWGRHNLSCNIRMKTSNEIDHVSLKPYKKYTFTILSLWVSVILFNLWVTTYNNVTFRYCITYHESSHLRNACFQIVFGLTDYAISFLNKNIVKE